MNDAKRVPDLEPTLRAGISKVLQTAVFEGLEGVEGEYVVLGWAGLYTSGGQICLKKGQPSHYYNYCEGDHKVTEHTVNGLRPGELNTLSAALLNYFINSDEC